jgi:pimeloyl-ACP methyl ester carboxylesterase
MGTVTTKDGTEIFYKDWGTGEPIFFHHGWPLSADDWDAQMMFFLGKGYRVIAHDRRGHGRSTQTATGHDMDTYADDAYEVVKKLDLKDAVHIGHSTGGGEVTRYVARDGKGRDKIRMAFQRKSSMAFATEPQTIVPSSTKTSRCRFMGSIGPARRYPKEFERIGGDRE